VHLRAQWWESNSGTMFSFPPRKENEWAVSRGTC